MNILVAPTVDWCGVFKKADELRFIPGQQYMGGSFAFDRLDKSGGWLTAVNASTGAIAWKYHSRRPMLASVMTTAADLVLTGELTGDFLVLDAGEGMCCTALIPAARSRRVLLPMRLAASSTLA